MGNAELDKDKKPEEIDADDIFAEVVDGAPKDAETPAEDSAASDNSGTPPAADGGTENSSGGEDSPAEVTPPAGDDAPGSEKKDERNDSPAEEADQLKKQAADNKAWATRVAQENASLKKRVGDLEATVAKKTPAKQEEDSDKLPDDLAEYYAQDPNFAKAVQFEAKKILKDRFGDFDPSNVSQRMAQVDSRVAQLDFETAVVSGTFANGQFVDGHADARKIMASPEYHSWFAGESIKDPTLNQINDPVAAIGVLDRYKAHVAEKAAVAHDAGQKTDAADNLKDIMSDTIEPGSGASSGKKSERKDQSLEEAFDEVI